MNDKLAEYLADPFLNLLYSELKKAGPLKAILLDITHVCNLRCQGCYFFAEDMDQYKSADEAEFDAFIEREKDRGTNYVTVVGGEPSLLLHRVRKIYENFWMVCATNGIRKIPYRGFENMSIAISVWGDHETDKYLRGSGKKSIFAMALKNYKDDPRAIWYYTTTPGKAHEIEPVVEQIIANGNYVSFNFYGDISALGGEFDHSKGFEQVRAEINRMIQRYPTRILTSSYGAYVASTGILYGERWGYDVCCSITFDNEINKERIKNGKLYNTHFRAYYSDLKTTRRCCVGNDRDCSNCYDVYAHTSWILMNMERHLGSKDEFTYWLTSMYLFYLGSRIVDFTAGIELLPDIHRRSSYMVERGQERQLSNNPSLEIENLIYEVL